MLSKFYFRVRFHFPRGFTFGLLEIPFYFGPSTLNPRPAVHTSRPGLVDRSRAGEVVRRDLGLAIQDWGKCRSGAAGAQFGDWGLGVLGFGVWGCSGFSRCVGRYNFKGGLDLDNYSFAGTLPEATGVYREFHEYGGC